MRGKDATVECPNCGESFSARRLACPECGSDANTGWKDADEIDYQAVDLPDDTSAPAPGRSRAMWWLLAVMVVAFAIAAVTWR